VFGIGQHPVRVEEIADSLSVTPGLAPFDGGTSEMLTVTGSAPRAALQLGHRIARAFRRAISRLAFDRLDAEPATGPATDGLWW
jgi:hypothetical protein